MTEICKYTKIYGNKYLFTYNGNSEIIEGLQVCKRKADKLFNEKWNNKQGLKNLIKKYESEEKRA